MRLMTTRMTLEDLRTSLNNFMPTWCEIVTLESGEIVIETGLKEEDGFLVELDPENYDQ